MANSKNPGKNENSAGKKGNTKPSDTATKKRQNLKQSESIKKFDKEKNDIEELKHAAQHKAVSNEVSFLVVGTIAVLLYLSLFGICGIVGKGIKISMYWLMGRVVSYLFPAMLVGIVIYIRLNPDKPFVTKKSTLFSFFVAFFAALMHVAGGYTTITYGATFKNLKSGKGGGFIGAFISESLSYLLGNIAAIIVLVVLMIICLMWIFNLTPIAFLKEKKSGRKKPDQYEFYDDYSDYEEDLNRKKEEKRKNKAKSNDSYQQIDLKEYQKEMVRRDFREVDVTQEKRASGKPKDYSNIVDRIKGYTPNETAPESAAGKSSRSADRQTSSVSPYDVSAAKPLERKKRTVSANGRTISEGSSENTGTLSDREMERKFGENQSGRVYSLDITKDRTYEDDEDYYYKNAKKEELVDVPEATRKKISESIAPSVSLSAAQSVPEAVSSAAGTPVTRIFSESDGSIENGDFADADSSFEPAKVPDEFFGAAVNSASGSPVKSTASTKAADTEPEKLVIDSTKAPSRPYKFPSINLLEKPPKTNSGAVKSKSYYDDISDRLEETFKSFNVDVEVTDVSVGPTVTRFELKPAVGVKVSRITSLADDIQLALAVPTLRIEAPIPGKAAVGIEVPNEDKQSVVLRTLLESPEFKNSTAKLAFTVGQDISGKLVIGDISKMPHMLIAGATGSGKSVFTNSIIMSILYKYEPKDVRMILVDPKVVEFKIYNGIPHLLIPVVTDPKKANSALNWAVMEMTDRYKKFAELQVKDIGGYNKKVAENPNLVSEAGIPYTHLPYIVIVIDELADLMAVAAKEVEDSINRLAALARAAGIHMVIATQRPDVSVITGLIKANIPSRVALSVSSAIDSRTILDTGGAEKLLGHGDMLYNPAGIPKPVRIQGAYVSEEEIERVVDFLVKQNEGYQTDTADIMASIDSGCPSVSEQMNGPESNDSGWDEYFAQAGRIIIQKDKASIGMLQRIYKIGFNRAARIMDQLCEAGVVGPEESTKPRKILMTEDEFNNLIENQ